MCSDLLCIFVSEKSLCSSPFAFFNYTVIPDVTRHHTPPCFEGVGPLSEDGVLDPHQHRDGSIIQQQGLCTAFTVAFLGDLESPCIGRALGELRAWKPWIHGTGKYMRAHRGQYPYLGLRVRAIDMGLATIYLIMVIQNT